ncbi:hypothetical protein Mgra_00004305 [Meloidogyne graminicola]|uniref:Uncharacterized protein n=1 Tax=Meloidogyne graminicola TaxID=189291 RepID=A0A8S9ZSU2_9BILA|nr:hypothetical protein Mgra_00004305 [Meloidogyne graminicola]KAF7636319.1 hypothetical protein Mgra_00004305 [Meloidogyne graminicola]
MVIVSQNSDGDIARRIDHTDAFIQNNKHIIIYTTIIGNSYLGNINCYGNISLEFKSCYPQTNKLLQYIGDICGEEGGNNPESVALRAIVKTNNLGMATSLPKFAFRDELYICENATSLKQSWRIVIALFQNYEKALEQFIVINNNNNISFNQLNKINLLEPPKFIINSITNSFDKINIKPIYLFISILFGILITLIFTSIIFVSICFILKYRRDLINYGKQ